MVFFGYLPGKSLMEATEAAANFYLQKSIAALAWLDGVFSCVIFDKKLQRHFVQCDAIGHRKMGSICRDGEALITSHDASLVATGWLPATIRPERTEWAAKVGWSLGAESFVDGIKKAPPLGYLEITKDQVIGRSGKLYNHPADFSSLDNSKEICEELIHYSRAFSPHKEKITSDLTSGVDSRAVLATLIASDVAKEKLVLSTVGASDSTEVVIAQRIARKYEIRHNVIPTPFKADTTEEVWNRAKFKAFLSNGDSNFKRCLTSIPQALSHHWFTGEGGGTFKGFYLSNPPRKLREEELLPLLLKKTRTQGKEQLERQINELLKVVPDPYAALTAFFATNYIGTMGAIVSRFSWFPYKGSPFLSTEAFRLSLYTKPRILKAKRIHRQLLRKHLRAATGIPINGLPNIFTFNYTMRKRLARYFQKPIVNHEREKRQLLLNMLDTELGSFLALDQHNNIWQPVDQSDDLLSQPKEFNAMDKRIMACAFQELLRDLRPKD